MSTLDEALRLADAGIPVFPVALYGKTPRTENGFHDATTDEDRIRAWFDTDPAPNIGVPTGEPSGVVAIDVDDSNPQDRIDDIVDKVGLEKLPDCIRHRTPSGGCHLLFRAPSWPVKTGAGNLGEKVDTRGEGGYVVVPPSRNGSGPYEAVRGRLGEDTPASLPDALRPHLDGSDTADADLSRDREEAVETLVPYFTEEANGHRHELARKLAGGLAHTEWPDGDVLAFFNRLLAETGDEEPEDRIRAVRDTLERRGAMKPNEGWPAFRKELSKIVGEDEAHYVVDEVRRTLGLWGGEATEGRGAQGRGDLFPIYNDAEITDLPDPAWLIEDVIQERGLTALFGKEAAGKTFIGLDESFRIGQGLSFCVRQVRQGEVLYIYSEGAPGLKPRVYAWKDHHGFDRDEDLGVYFVPTRVNLMDEEDHNLDRLLRSVEEAVPDPDAISLVVVDTLAKSFGSADENETKAMNTFTDRCARIRDRLDTAVQVVHHTGWTETQRERGNRALRANFDTVIKAEKSGQTITLSCEKQKDGSPFEDIRLKMVEVEVPMEEETTTSVVLQSLEDGYVSFWHDLDEQEQDTLRALYEEGPLSSSEWHEASGLPESSFYRKREALIEAGWVEWPPPKEDRPKGYEYELTTEGERVAEAGEDPDGGIQVSPQTLRQEVGT